MILNDFSNVGRIFVAVTIWIEDVIAITVQAFGQDRGRAQSGRIVLQVDQLHLGKRTWAFESVRAGIAAGSGISPFEIPVPVWISTFARRPRHAGPGLPPVPVIPDGIFCKKAC